MLIYHNAEVVHGQRKFGNPWSRITVNQENCYLENCQKKL